MFKALSLAWYRLEYRLIKNTYSNLEKMKDDHDLTRKERFRAAVKLTEILDRKEFLERKLGLPA